MLQTALQQVGYEPDTVCDSQLQQLKVAGIDGTVADVDVAGVIAAMAEVQAEMQRLRQQQLLVHAAMFKMGVAFATHRKSVFGQQLAALAERSELITKQLEQAAA